MNNIVHNEELENIHKYTIFASLMFLLCVRIFAMFFIPLNDATEARYGEIARIMLETGNWITPMQEYGVPFWAKPPLSTWLSSLSMAMFGVNEFAARLPALICSFGVLSLVWYVAKLKHGLNFAFVSCLILASSFFFYLDAGTVMTDPVLLFCTSLTTFGFWLAITYKSKSWGYAFFVALGLGMLAKGPVAWVLAGLPLFLWVLINNQWKKLSYLPWISGILLTCLIFLPWYIIAEQHTPGFLNYFIIGENINRFLKPGWEGDMYGGAHLAPHGYIWIYAAIGIFPWVIPLLGLGWKNLSFAKNILTLKFSAWLSFLLLSLLVPLIFFTFASNIIYPYVFPSLPFFALLFAELLMRFKFNYTKLALIAASSGMIFLIISLAFIYKPEYVEKSQKRLINLYTQHQSTDSKLIYWLPKAHYSARFYSSGKVIATTNSQDIQSYFSKNKIFLAINEKNLNDLPQNLSVNMHEVGRVNKYILFELGSLS